MKNDEPSDKELANMKEMIEAAEKIFGPIPGETTIQEVACWLKAHIEDLERKVTEEDRASGLLAEADAELFIEVLKPFAGNARLPKAMEYLRMKRRKGHKQKRALEIWDTYYKDNPNAYLFTK